MFPNGDNFDWSGRQISQVSDLEYILVLEDERIPLEGSVTLGRHLDNDLVLAGEDVLDYHLRIEVGARGPKALPLGAASLRLNGVDLTEAVGLVPGDRLEIGQETLVVEVERNADPEADEWRLHGASGGSAYPVHGELSVGRGETSGLQLRDDHISRNHARLFERSGVIFVQDFGSSNGTYVNGIRVAGGCRLFHGDEICFDTRRYQLVGQGGDLTPVNPHSGEQGRLPLVTPIKDSAERATDTTEIAAVTSLPEALPLVDTRGETGAFLLGASEPVSGLTFRTGMGRTLIGRSDDCDVVVSDRTVSARHAELVVRPEGATVTNLMSTNGTRVNGDEVQSAQLHDGDILRLGRVSLVFKDVPAEAGNQPWLKNLQWSLLAAAVALVVSLVMVLLF